MRAGGHAPEHLDDGDLADDDGELDCSAEIQLFDTSGTIDLFHREVGSNRSIAVLGGDHIRCGQRRTDARRTWQGEGVGQQAHLGGRGGHGRGRAETAAPRRSVPQTMPSGSSQRAVPDADFGLDFQQQHAPRPAAG